MSKRKPTLRQDSISTRTADSIKIDAPPIRVEVRCKNLGASLWNFCQDLEQLDADCQLYAFINGEWKRVGMKQARVDDELN